MAAFTSLNTKLGLYHAGFVVEDPALPENKQLSVQLWDDKEITLDIQKETFSDEGAETDEITSITIPEEQRQEFAQYLRLLAEILLRRE